ncbi:MAG: GNAT family N-acetyltransferase [Chloroflexota bacterium]|nr:GNAT family N-acetyltransferase [Chloroflexota bacterium]
MTPAKPTVRLRPMRPDEYPAFIAASEAGYTLDMVVHGGMLQTAAEQKSREDHLALLPDGLATAGQWIFVAEVDGASVGHLWVAERGTPERRTLFIYGVEIDEAQRGRGFGRQTMLLAEGEARARGIGRVELNVFGGNDRARGLYRSLGYAETSVQMGKDLVET